MKTISGTQRNDERESSGAEQGPSDPRILAVVNARAGNADSARIVELLREADGGRAVAIRETRPGDDLEAIAREAARDGFGRVVAAGGDGTVSAVANGLVGSRSALAIVPMGTTNVLARELGVPLDLEAACRLAVGPARIVRIDAMKVDASHYFTQIGVGIDALMIHDTPESEKRRLGVLAYIRSCVANLAAFKPRRVVVVADDRTVRSRSRQVILANCGALGSSGLRWGEDVRVDDGRIDVCVFQPRTPLEYPRIAWAFLCGRQRSDPRLVYLHASRFVTVDAGDPLPVQGDGEIIARTPVRVEVVPNALRVVVPETPPGDVDAGTAP